MFQWTDGTDYLMHYGIKGQKWGERRFQYEDGSLTPAGKERYGVGDSSTSTRSVSNRKPHARKKNVKSGSATDVWTGRRVKSGSMAGARYDASPDVRKRADVYLETIDDIYDQIINLRPDEFEEWIKNNATDQLGAMVELGTTKSEIIEYLNNLRKDVGSAIKENPNSEDDFESALDKSTLKTVKKLEALSNVRVSTKAGRTSKGYSKVEEK